MSLPAPAEALGAEGVNDGPTTGDLTDLVLDSVPVGVLICTPEGDRANAALRRLWRGDVPIDRHSLATALEPIHEPARAGADGRLRRVRRPSPIDVVLGGRRAAPGRYRLARADGSVAVVRVEGEPLEQAGRPIGAAFIVTDETAIRDAERLRDSFLGILGHEIRTPITSIVGGSQLLRSPTLDPDVRAEVAAAVVEEAERLDRLVEQLIRLAAVDARGISESEPIHLAHAARRAIARERRRLPRLKLELDVAPVVPAAAGDEGFVAEVIAILLDNAAKYAGAASRIVVSVREANDSVEVHVLDEGPGLPAKGGDAVFQLYERGAAGPSDHTGTGIGLFVARAIIEAMGGRIWAKNRAEGGADVGFGLPVAPL